MVFIPEFVESKHPRAPRGGRSGGQFISKGGRPAHEFRRFDGSPERVLARAQKSFQGGRTTRNVQVFRAVAPEFAAKLEGLKPGTRMQKRGEMPTTLQHPGENAMRILLPKGTQARLLPSPELEVALPKSPTLVYEGKDKTGAFQFRAVTGDIKVTPRPVKKEATDEGLLGRATGTHPKTVSVRLISAKRAEQQKDRYLRVDIKAMQEDPKQFKYNIELLRDAAFYPNFRKNEVSGTPEQIARNAKKHIKQNLMFLYRNATPDELLARTWYEGAHKLVTEQVQKFGFDEASVSAVYAALSPNTDWDVNVYVAGRVIDIYSTQQKTAWDDDMTDTAFGTKDKKGIWKPKDRAALESIKGRTLGELVDPVEKAMWIRTYDEAHSDRQYREFLPDGSMGDLKRNHDKKRTPSKAAWEPIPAITNAVMALESQGDRTIISDVLGNGAKVRSFYNNILDPWSKNEDVTIDTHAYGAALLRPLSAGSAAVLHGMGTSPKKVHPGPSWRASSGSAFTGIDGLYGLYADAYREAAHELGIRPNELQAVVWVVKRHTLFTRDMPNKDQAAVDGAWRDYHDGKATLGQTQQAVLKIGRDWWDRREGRRQLAPATLADILHGEEVLKPLAHAVAQRHDFDPAMVRISNEEKTFTLNDQQYPYAGSANPETGEVVIYSGHVRRETLPAILAHEIQHVKYNTFQRDLAAETKEMQRELIKTPTGPDDPMHADGTLRPDWAKRYPLYQQNAELTRDFSASEMSASGGFTSYASDWWNAWVHRGANTDEAVGETLAEMAVLEEQGQPLAIRLPGTPSEFFKTDRKWRQYKKMIDDNWTRHRAAIKASPSTALVA